MDPRFRRLALEQSLLEELSEMSDLISYEAVDEIPGMPPEEYLIHFNVKSIIGIDDYQNPIYGHRHTLRVVFPSNFPMIDIPSFTIISPIWHPNIYHAGQFVGHVCTNKEEHDNSTTIEEFVMLIGRMLQWKNYHAIWVPPYPQDSKVAEWVREYAEPEGIVNKRKGIVVDSRPLVKPTREWLESRVEKKRRIIVEVKRKTARDSPTTPSRLHVEVKTKDN